MVDSLFRKKIAKQQNASWLKINNWNILAKITLPSSAG
jgi:hypothetical protein